jgi:cytochrome c oxidase subunit 2
VSSTQKQVNKGENFMKKHLLFFTFIIGLIVVLSACGSKTDNTAASSTAPASTDTTSAAPIASAAGTAAPSTSGTVQEVKLIASSVNFKYDQTEYKVKKGVPVHITLQNKDGMHGANIADFGVNLQSKSPTDKPEATFTPDKTGTFVIKCSVPCGAGHMTMTANLVVE